MYSVIPTLNGFQVQSPTGVPIETYRFNPKFQGSERRAKDLAEGHAARMNICWNREYNNSPTSILALDLT